MQSLRAAMVGFGFIAEKGHLPAYLASMRGGGPFELSAIADGCAARRDLARRLVPGARVYPDHESLLEAEAARLDFVDVATPPCDHASVADAALDRGLHVLCEKPLTATVEAARDLLAHARRVGRVVFPCHNYKHAPVVKTVRGVLDSGEIGDVRQVTLQTFRHTHARGVSEWRPDWRRERAIAGGGIAMDHGSHSFYLAFDWMSAYPSAIAAVTSTTRGYDTEDCVSCTLRFPDDRIASVHLTWTGGMRRVLYTIHGTRGAIRVEDDDVEIVRPRLNGDGSPGWDTRAGNVASGWMDASHASWFRSILDGLAASVARGELVGKEAEDALRCIEAIDASYRSARDGSREVALTGGDSLTRPVLTPLHRVSA